MKYKMSLKAAFHQFIEFLYKNVVNLSPNQQKRFVISFNFWVRI